MGDVDRVTILGGGGGGGGAEAEVVAESCTAEGAAGLEAAAF